MAAPWNHNIHYHGAILRSVPPDCRLALDIGCGRGLLVRQVAQAAGTEAIGIDTDRDSILAASAAPGSSSRTRFVLDDVMTYPFGQQFDFITAVATLHHLPLELALSRFRDLLRPGGTLAIVGLYRPETLTDFAWAAAALPVSRALRCFRNYSDVGAPLHRPEQTIREIRAASQKLLPGAVLQRRLLFRYSLIWKKPF